MRIQLLDCVERLSEIADDWNRLAADHPMRGYDWLAGWWRHYGQGGGGDGDRLLVLAVVDENERVVGLAPWRLNTSAISGNVIRWLGDGEVCTDHLTLLIEEAKTDAVTAALADYLSDEFDEWDCLQLMDVDADDQRVCLLVSSLEQRGCKSAPADAGACWSIDLPGDWEEFLARQSKSHRKQLRRSERRVLESDACAWRPVTTSDELHEAWPTFVDLHQRRRRSLGEPGCFASERFASFHRELAGRLLERGQLRMSRLQLDGSPAAAELHFAGAGGVFAYQGGVDPDRLDDEPGRLSNIATIKAAIDEGAKTFDFLRGDEPYKAHWRAEPRPTVHHRVVPPRRSALLRAGANQMVSAMRDGLRGLRNSAKR